MAAPLNKFEDYDYDVVFVVKDSQGNRRYVFASYEGGGNYQQWGEDREILSKNVQTVTDWARSIFEQEEQEEPAACENCGCTDNDGSDICPDCGGALVDPE